MGLYGNEVTFKMAERLLKAGADVNAKNRFGGTALLEVSLHYQYDFVKLLLDHGADPYLKDNDGISTLRFAQYNPKMRELMGKSYRENMRVRKESSTEKQCEGCGLNKKDNKKCSACYHVHYCSSKCQSKHWTEHKEKCKEIQSEYKVFHCMANYTGYSGIDSNGKDYERPPGTWSKKSHFVVKIQIPLLEKWQDATLIYNRDRSFLKHMAKIQNEKSFDELIEVIKTEGFNGLKGYFHAVLEDVASETIKINTKRILPPQPW